jgi:CrcB protein
VRAPLAGHTGSASRTGSGYGWRVWTAVASGGLLGTELRYVLGLLFPDQPGDLPWATLGINILGSFVLAALTTIWIARPQTAFWLRAAIGPGVLGSFTTFSAVVFSTDQLTRSRPPRLGTSLCRTLYLAGACGSSGRLADRQGAGRSSWGASMTALLVGLFGIAGALLRFAVDGWLAGFPSPRRHWPWATLLVNVAGSFVIGLSVGVTAVFGPAWHSALATGFAGGLTTFSSWTTATVRLASERRYLAAAANILANLLLGLAAAAAGIAVGGG